MKLSRTVALPVVVSLAVACSRQAPSNNQQPAAGSGAPAASAAAPAAIPSDRKYLLERVDDAAVAQLYADGFSALPLKEKTLIWHLYQAAIAGRDIFYDQKHRDALEMRAILEQIVAHPQGIDAATLAEIQRYTKLFWINNGPYNNLTARKFVLKATPQAFAAAAKTAAQNGATFATRPGETLDADADAAAADVLRCQLSTRLSRTRRPGPGKDILQASANNLYSGVSMADLKGFTEKNGLNSRLVKRDGTLVEEVYKIDGRYSSQITEIVKHLEAAIPFATEPMANALRALVQWYRTGDDADRAKYDIAWVQDKASPVDTINGFIEVYLDPRGIKGAWEALVFYVNQEKTARIKKLAENAQWFEDRMPWDPKYRKPTVQGIVANAIDVVVETGDSGPVTPIGINLPNDQTHPRAVRQQVGGAVERQRSLRAVDTPGTMRGRVLVDARRSRTRGEVRRTSSGELTTDMHEVIGHASGRMADGVKGTPQELIKEAVLGARRRARRSRRPLFHRRPEARRARRLPGRRP